VNKSANASSGTNRSTIAMPQPTRMWRAPWP
jgi:hypothetical protein